jgi:hypothetical protein
MEDDDDVRSGNPRTEVREIAIADIVQVGPDHSGTPLPNN